MPREEIAALLASWLRRAGFRRGEGVDVIAAAKAVGIDQKNLRQYLAGETSPSIDSLERIAAAIDWEVVVSFLPAKRRRRKKPPPA
jgi:transcriptional regulator with XRE-family HTH domain